MKLNNIFPNYDTFKSDVIDKLNLLFPNVEWLNEQNSYMSFQTLYALLFLYYGDRDIRYDNAQTFINKFTFDLADVLPDIYAKQQVFISNELNRYLSSAQNRAIKISSTTNSNRNQNNNSKAANSTTPTNIVITSTAELNNLPIATANLSNIELIDNINSNNEQTNFKYIDDLIKNLTSDYSLRLKEFMNLIKNHFTFIDTSNVQKEDSLYEGTRFRNGYYVSNVDYLGVENQEQIKLTNSKVQTNTTNIEKLQSAIGSLPDFDNIINTINKNTGDIKVINNEQVVQNNNIQTNTTNITNNTKLINEVIEELNNSTLINYKGEWVASTTALLGEVWSFNNELWLCKVSQTTEQPQENNEWDLLTAPAIDLSNYYTKNEIENQQQEQNNTINTNKTNIENLKSITKSLSTNVNSNTEELNTVFDDLTNLENSIQEQNNQISQNTTNIENLQTLTQEHTTQINTLKTDLGNQVVDVNNKFNDYYTKNDWTNYNVDTVKTNLINIGYDVLKIDNYSNTEITLTAPQKITAITTNGSSEVFRTETRTDGFYINNKKTIATYEASNLDSSNKVIDLGNKRKLLVFRFYWPSGNSTDSWSNLPEAIKDVNNIKYVEQVDFNIYDDGTVYSCIDCYPKVSLYANRLYITRTSASNSHWNGKQARFRVIVTTM